MENLHRSPTWKLAKVNCLLDSQLTLKPSNKTLRIHMISIEEVSQHTYTHNNSTLLQLFSTATFHPVNISILSSFIHAYINHGTYYTPLIFYYCVITYEIVSSYQQHAWYEWWYEFCIYRRGWTIDPFLYIYPRSCTLFYTIKFTENMEHVFPPPPPFWYTMYKMVYH